MSKRIGRVTFYPFRSAMHGAVNIQTKRWGFVCFKPPTRAFGKWWPWYFYLSPNATPWAATLLLGPRFNGGERHLARVRRAMWGHGYDCDKHDPQSVASYVESLAGDLPPQEPVRG